jgi:hypothetical protein
MGINAHSGVAIAQTVAYVPIVPLAIFILIRNRSHQPAMAWYPFILFSMSQTAESLQLVTPADADECYSAFGGRSCRPRAAEQRYKRRIGDCRTDPPERRPGSPACHHSGPRPLDVRTTFRTVGANIATRALPC